MAFDIRWSNSSSSQSLSAIDQHPDICEITDENLDAFKQQFSVLSAGREPLNVDMDKILVTAEKTAILAASGIGAGMGILARATRQDQTPVLALWYRSPANSLTFREGISRIKEQMINENCIPQSIEVFVIGGQGPNEADDNPGTFEDEEEIRAIATKHNICGVKFNRSPNEYFPLDLIFTSSKIYFSTHRLFDCTEYKGQPFGLEPLPLIKYHPDLVVTTEKNLFRNVPNVGMDKALINMGYQALLATDSLGACIAICLRGKTQDEIPVLALWHRTPINGLPFQTGIRILKQRMIEKGCLLDSIEVFAIGGQNPTEAFPNSSPSVASSENPGNIEDQEELLAIAKEENIRGVKFNLSKSQWEPLDLVLTPKKIYIRITPPLFIRSDLHEDAGLCFDACDIHK